MLQSLNKKPHDMKSSRSNSQGNILQDSHKKQDMTLQGDYNIGGYVQG